MLSSWPETSEPPRLSADEVHVWAVPLSAAEATADEFTALLSSEDCDRAARFKSADARRRFIVSHAALQTLLGHYLKGPPKDISFTTGANGKPRLHGESVMGLNFNLAHSGEVALIAVAKGCEVGVDVERLREVYHWEEIARRYFHPGEAAQILAVQARLRPAAFFQCWTRKEAILKALGTGLSHPLNTFQVPIESHGGAWIECLAKPGGQPARCFLQSLTLDSAYTAAVACLNAERKVRCWTFRF